MSVNISELKNLNNLLSLHLRRKHIIVLNPEKKEEFNQEIEDKVVYDAVKWSIPEELQEYIDELKGHSRLSIEDKILLIYEKLCHDYVYDDNLISYIQKVEDDTYDLPDWYGRDVSLDWNSNREQHNRRVCYELSRYLAKSLTELLEDNDEYDICIFWDKDLTHYFVGLSGKDYKVTLDLDNFFNIKDLTRLKTGLTAEGITILEDKKKKFLNTLNYFNRDREQYSIEKMENEIDSKEEDSQNKNDTDNEDIEFLKNALQILIEKYQIDSQGIFEYMKEIVDMKLGPESRKKVWKKLEGTDDKATRYIRCLLIDAGNKMFLIDGDAGVIREFKEEEFSVENASFIPFKGLSHDEDERYNGS